MTRYVLYIRTLSLHSSPGPELIVMPSNLTVEVGDAVLLPCQATGVPHPKVVWHSQNTGKINNDPGEFG